MRVRCNCSSNLGLHSFAIDTDGALYGWGLNSAHQTGVGSAASDEPVLTPTRVRGLPAGESVAEVACGYAHSVVLMENGQVFAWGDNRFSQAGRPAATAPIAEIHEVVVEGERIASVGESPVVRRKLFCEFCVISISRQRVAISSLCSWRNPALYTHLAATNSYSWASTRMDPNPSRRPHE